MGDFKLLMKVPNISYIVPPEETNCTQTSFPNFKKVSESIGSQSEAMGDTKFSNF